MGVTAYASRLRTGARGLLESSRYAWHRFARRLTIDAPPTFIVGCGHSGTSILLAILSAHPRIFAVPYESYIAGQKADFRNFQAALAHFDRLAIAAGKRRWIEKTPRHILYIGKILEWLPGAKIILILRDGRDVARSFQKRKGGLEYGIRRWCEENLAGRRYWGHPGVHVMKYEDLIGEFKTTMTRVLSFLGEEYHPAMEKYYRRKRRWYSNKITKPETPFGENHAQHRNWQINQPLFDGRKTYKEMSAEELAMVERIAGPMLAEFGYLATGDEASQS